MLTFVEFRSDAFPADPDEAELINPGIYGRRLARFLVEGLQKQGFVCAEPATEDWGWYITVENETFDLWIGCANYDDGFHCRQDAPLPVVERWSDRRYYLRLGGNAMRVIVALAVVTLAVLAQPALVEQARAEPARTVCLNRGGTISCTPYPKYWEATAPETATPGTPASSLKPILLQPTLRDPNAWVMKPQTGAGATEAPACSLGVNC